MRFRHIFIMNYQENFPRIDQIIGRGIRYKSHSDLDEWQKTSKQRDDITLLGIQI